jgi:hypothetical protein
LSVTECGREDSTRPGRRRVSRTGGRGGWPRVVDSNIAETTSKFRGFDGRQRRRAGAHGRPTPPRRRLSLGHCALDPLRPKTASSRATGARVGRRSRGGVGQVGSIHLARQSRLTYMPSHRTANTLVGTQQWPKGRAVSSGEGQSGPAANPGDSHCAHPFGPLWIERNGRGSSRGLGEETDGFLTLRLSI